MSSRGASMPGRKVTLITGGAGFIGAHLAKRLITKNHNVIVIDQGNFASSCLGKLGLFGDPLLTCIEGSVTDDAVWQQLPLHFDYVVHAAAILGIERVAREPIETMDVTILG